MTANTEQAAQRPASAAPGTFGVGCNLPYHASRGIPSPKKPEYLLPAYRPDTV